MVDMDSASDAVPAPPALSENPVKGDEGDDIMTEPEEVAPEPEALEEEYAPLEED